MRWAIIGILWMCVVAAGCKAKEGEACSEPDDCEQGLKCATFDWPPGIFTGEKRADLVELTGGEFDRSTCAPADTVREAEGWCNLGAGVSEGVLGVGINLCK